jgi:hypothetical protein
MGCDYQKLTRLWLALILAFSPWEKVLPAQVFVLADVRPANPVASPFQESGGGFTLSWRRGRDEDERIK